MPRIMPVSDLRNNFNMISEICHKEAEPVYITKNGQDDMVVMSMAAYEQMATKLDLYSKLSVAQAQSKNNAPTKSHEAVMATLREKINGKV